MQADKKVRFIFFSNIYASLQFLCVSRVKTVDVNIFFTRH